MNMNKKALAIFLAALLVASTVSCGKKPKDPMQPGTPPDNDQNTVPPSEKPDDPADPQPNDKAGITLSADTHQMKCGETYQIVASFIPEFGTDSKKLTYTSSDTAILTVTEQGGVTAIAEGQATVTVENENKKFKKTITITVTSDVVPPSTDDPKPERTEYLTLIENAKYLGNLVLVNPTYSTPTGGGADSLVNIRQNTTSEHLRVSLSKHQVTAEMLKALSKMVDDYYDALSGGNTTPKDVLVSESYRTPEEQQEMVDNKTDTTPVGYSDFQTGLSVNLKLFDGTFTYLIGDNTVAVESAWLMEHYAEYGFILRYPDGKKEQTGYDPSSSHFRYVGVPHSLYIKEHNLSLEEYVELLKQHTMQNPLQITTADKKYSVYYVAAQGQNTTLPIPTFDQEVAYTYSGNNHDGFIVTVEAHWAEDAFDPTLPTPNENPGITLDKTTHTMIEGESFTLGAVFVPLYNIDDKTLSFLSSDPTIATVDENGLITALAQGQVTITVQNVDGKYQANCEITISAKAPVPNPNPGITLESTELALQTGDYYQLEAVFVPEFDTDNQMLVYSCDGTAVTIDGTGLIFAKEIGTATITIKNLDGTYSITCTVTVTKGANIDAGITLDKSELTVEEESETQIGATFIPKYDEDDTTLFYESSDPTIVTVDENGKIKALKIGQATITIKDASGEFEAVVKVTVTEKPNENAGIVLDKDKITLEIGKSDKIVPTFITDFDDDSRMLIYASSDPTIATVTGTGEITAIKAGIVTITVKNITGKHTATCTVYIPNPEAKLTLDKTELTLMEEDKGKITATFIPVYDIDSKVLSYVSSNTDILTVDENGNITAIKYGTATITVKNADGEFVATCTVTVTEKPDPNAGITLEKSEITLEKGQSTTINATFIPVFDADSKVLTFTSSNNDIVSVDKDGKITALKHGIVTITVKNADGKFVKTVTVSVPNPNAGITLDKSEIKLEIGDEVSIGATFIPVYDADSTILTYESSDVNIATIDANGKIIAKKTGTVTITIKNADEEFTKTCTVRVANPDAAVVLDKISITLSVNATGKIEANYVPVYDNDDLTLTYESSDPSIVTVDANGNIKAVKHGIVTITVKDASGNHSAKCTVFVPNPNAGITPESNHLTIDANDTAEIEVNFIPLYETDDTTLVYSVENPQIASVDKNGIVTGLLPGNTTITITSADGVFTAEWTIEVKEVIPANPNAKLTLDKEEITLHATGNKTDILKVKEHIPEYENNKTITFESSDTGVVTVDQNGVLVAVKAGTATITVRNGNLSATCKVTVTGITVGTDPGGNFGDFIPYN